MAVILETEDAKLVKDQDGKYIWRKGFMLSQVFDSQSAAVDAMDHDKINWRDMRHPYEY